jgi:Fe-S-cluster containining protein
MKNHDKKGLWYKDGLRFQCQRCGNCCRGEPGYIWVSLEEAKNISQYLGLQVEEFTRKHLKKVGKRFSLLELPNGDCIMYKARSEGNGPGGCKIYPMRPGQCSTFPFWPANLESLEAWTRLETFCKGIDRGRLYTFTDIQKISLGLASVDTYTS